MYTTANAIRLRGVRACVLVLCAALLVVGAAGADLARGAAFDFKPGSVKAETRDNGGDEVTQAGAHPNALSSFDFTTRINDKGFEIPAEDVRDVRVELPPGAIGDPEAGPKCALNDLTEGRCAAGTQVGQIRIDTYSGGPLRFDQHASIYNFEPTDGKTATFGFRFERNNVFITAEVRTEGDKGATAVIHDLPGGLGVFGQTLTLWGVPADPIHDFQRCYRPDFVTGICVNPPGEDPWKSPQTAGVPRRPFWSNPASCGVTPTTRIWARSWQHPERWIQATAISAAPTGCDKLGFEPTMNVGTTTAATDTPSGLDVDIHIPQNLDPDGLATPPLKRARVTLPEGMTINPSSATGLDACTDAQLQLASRNSVACPDAAKIGTVRVDTPLLKNPLSGSVYVRAQASDDPASGDMFRIALVLENKERGLLMKLPGSVKVNPGTGRIETVFDNNPQLPVSRIQLSLKAGDRAPLATPATCGTKTVEGEFTSWGGQTEALTDTVRFACPGFGGGFAPAFSAGADNPAAGAFSPFLVQVDRPDHQQFVDGVTLTMPTGLLAKLTGIPLCPEDRANAGTCAIESRVGSATVGSGSGAPFYLKNQPVYLAGPYKGAPFSLSVAARAKAGPFDLGTVVVRQAINIDPVDAHVTIVSDPLPTIVKGVPLRLRSLDVKVDRPGFMLNPTSCAPKAIDGVLGSSGGATAAVSARFQVVECASLDVKPSLALSLSGKGQTTDGKHPAITATVSQSAGQANLKKVRVALPLSLALDPDNASGLCEFVDGSKITPTCPKASIVGIATAVTPILDEPLSGPVYFVKNVRKDPKSGREIRTLPKLVIPLVGQNGLKLTLTGTSAVEDDQLVNTFDDIPDAPVSSFKLNINGGKGGILVVSDADICKSTQVAGQQVDGQNNKSADADVFIQTPSCPLKVLSKKVTKRSVAIKVGGLGAGKVTVTGRGIKKTTKTISKSTVATITAKRTKGKPGKVTVSFDPAGPAKARKTSK
jgi:hypothetical protein